MISCGLEKSYTSLDMRRLSKPHLGGKSLSIVGVLGTDPFLARSSRSSYNSIPYLFIGNGTFRYLIKL